MNTTDSLSDLESSVIDRYAAAADRVEPALCCASDGYDPALLEAIPTEILEKDYGCGDPTRYVREGETVIDLGSGAGKACFIMAQKVGPRGRVIGIDFNDAMLDLSRKYVDTVAEKIGFGNVAFVKAKIQDLGLDLDRVAERLAGDPVDSVESLGRFQEFCREERRSNPAITSDSVDVIVSNCVLNLVRTEEKEGLFAEMFRVLRRGGRAVISDIVCDEEPTEEMKNDPELWSGCISGAFTETDFLARFERAGFHGIEILERGEQPWRTIDGIEFRSMTVRAFKGKQGPCLERNQAVIYRGPWSSVRDDDGHTFRRGERMALCDKTFRLMTDPDGPYGRDVLPVEPLVEIPLDEAGPFNCRGTQLRDPRETKGEGYTATTQGAAGENGACDEPGCC